MACTEKTCKGLEKSKHADYVCMYNSTCLTPLFKEAVIPLRALIMTCLLFSLYIISDLSNLKLFYNCSIKTEKNLELLLVNFFTYLKFCK